MNSMYGAEIDALRRAAQELRSEADRLEAEAAALTRQLGAVQWVGGVAVRFSDLWQQAHSPQLVVTSNFLRESATALDRNAAQQESAAASDGRVIEPPLAGVGTAPSPSTDPGAADLLAFLMSVLGLSAGAAESLLSLLQKSKIDVKWLQDFLEKNKTFIGVLDKVFTVADIVTDLVTDMAENPDLPMDERALHAVVEAGVRFALSEGIEKGVEAVTTAIGSAIGGPVGAAAGHVIGDLIGGVIADQVEGMADGAVDFVADEAVDAYRVAKEGVESVIEVGRDIVEGGQRIVDGAIDVGEKIVDNVGGFIGGLF
jgi:uncharacterized protein YukE